MDLALTCVTRGAILISRLRLDAQLFEFPVAEKKKLGRKPIKGKRIYLKNLLKDPTQIWCKETMFWYGGETRNVEYLNFICLWYQAGKPPVTLRIILVKTPDGKNEAETFFSTDLNMAPNDIIKNFVRRWNIEVTFEETRAHLGVETQRQWSDKAIAHGLVFFCHFGRICYASNKSTCQH